MCIYLYIWINKSYIYVNLMIIIMYSDLSMPEPGLSNFYVFILYYEQFVLMQLNPSKAGACLQPEGCKPDTDGHRISTYT